MPDVHFYNSDTHKSLPQESLGRQNFHFEIELILLYSVIELYIQTQLIAYQI